MMKCLFLLAALVAQAQSAALISGDVAAKIGRGYSLQFTSSDCSAAPTLGDFQLLGATAAAVVCIGEQQSYSCLFTLSSTPQPQFTIKHTDSNMLTVDVEPNLSGVFTSAVIDGDNVNIRYRTNMPSSKGPGGFAVAGAKILSIKQVETDLFEIVVPFKGEAAFQVIAQEAVAVDPTTGAIVAAISGSVQVGDSLPVTLPPSNQPAPSPDGAVCAVSAWSAWSSCNAACGVNDPTTFAVVAGTRSRTRTITAAGAGCPALSESENCSGEAAVRCPGVASLPASGEYLGMCAGDASAASTKCVATRRESPLSAATAEEGGCACDQGCINRGDCCQAFFLNNCCTEGNCAALYPEKIYTRGTFPLTCTVGDCFSEVAVEEAMAGPKSSYFCYCDEQCTFDSLCCGGIEARDNVCLF